MPQPVILASSEVHFGPFRANLRTGELWSNGRKIKLEGQPFQILGFLLEKPGQLVTREELQQKLWPADTFVDFEHSINTAIKRLREALGDSAETPRFIETLPRRGYRFIYPLSNDETVLATPAKPRFRPRAGVVGIAGLLVLALIVSIPWVRDRLMGHRLSGKTLRVAVLPLKNLTGNPEQEYFAAGMTEMLITELGRISTLQVTSHQSVLGYSQSSKPLPQIARELGVDAVVEGTVQRANDRVRVTVNFVQAQPENHLLAESYDKDARDIFEVEEDVARNIARAIRMNLPERPSSSSPARRIPPGAIEAYLRGTYLLANGTDKDREEARVCFEKAVEMDPGFAQPYASLAIMYAHGGAVRAGGTGAGRTPTRQWAERALKLDDSLAEAHAALAWLSISDWDFPKAAREFKRAIELNPSLARARAWYAQFLGIMDRYPEAFAQAEVALQLAPGAPNTVSHAVEPYLTGGRVDEAIAQWRTIIELHPDYSWAHYFLALGYLKKGMYREAVGEAEETIRLSERSPASLSLLASAYAKAGDQKRSLKIVQELETQIRQGGGGNEVALARAYAALGENEKALALLEVAYKNRRPGLAFVTTTPQFDSLGSDPRFGNLLQRVGLRKGSP
jgi:TolB-like protein/DNA-binding winged helix-turn-helix (wHTH) protein/Tfp pilus assembly protein PilF